jgi:hypothetical protein
MNFGNIIGELVRWAPVIERLTKLFGDPEKALKGVAEWEAKKRAENDARLDKARRDRDDG